MLSDEHETVSRLVRGFIADVRTTTGLDVDLLVSRPGGRAEVSFRLTEGGSQVGEWVASPDATPLDWLEWLFDWIQHDWVIEQLHGAWPRCPRHAHPLAVRRTKTDLEWACPSEPALVAPVGAVTALVGPA